MLKAPSSQYSLLPSVDAVELDDYAQPNKADFRRHRDPYNRIWHFNRSAASSLHVERHISPYDWSLQALIVQAAPKEASSQKSTPWYQKSVQNSRGQRALRTAVWGMTGSARPFKYVAASMALVILMWIPDGPKQPFGAAYPPCEYKYFGNVKAASNELEEPPSRGTALRTIASFRGAMISTSSEARTLMPRRLNLLGPADGIDGPPEVTTVDTAEWLRSNPESSGMPYLFVSFTAQHFDVQTQQVWDLQDLSVRATQVAGLSAYWSSANCIGDAEFENDVYHINDAIRASAGVAIVLPGRAGDPGGEQRLREWASRVWTFPEIILSPAHKSISVWAWPDMSQPLRVLPKNQFAALVWSDSLQSRQLIDHYEGSLILSRLQLPSIALSCLYNRSVQSGTKQYHLPGDHAYALSGLLSTRPVVDKTDSAFQAFARLSLANDSDKLLERLACILPQSHGQSWHDMTDAWGVKLWDIHPKCEIAAVCHGDTVLIDGAKGASVIWNELPPCGGTRPVSLRLKSLRVLVMIIPSIMVLGIMLIIYGAAITDVIDDGFSGANGGIFIAGVSITCIGVCIQPITPWVVRRLYGKRVTSYQAWLVGIEGYMPLAQLERMISPEIPQRLEWSRFSSPYSSHHTNEYGECVGNDPHSVPEIWERIQHEKASGRRLFTLVDTATMTASLFTAERPPSSFIVCGSEGGMQRAIGVSYDWTTQTLYKETVLRMETPAVERMTHVSRFRFGFKRNVRMEGVHGKRVEEV